MSNMKTGASGFKGMIGGLADPIEKLGDLAEKGEKLSKTGELTGEPAIRAGRESTDFH